MELNSCNVFAKLDSREILAVACSQIEIDRVICPWVGLGSDVKLSPIEWKDRIQGNGTGTCNYVLPLPTCKIETLKPDNLSLMPVLVILIHIHH
jgi:hypothetical protein